MGFLICLELIWVPQKRVRNSTVVELQSWFINYELF